MDRKTTPSPADPFLYRLSRELKPLDAWGSFRPGARPAAVTAVLYRRDGAWHVPFVQRRRDLRSHPGQVALPGGAVNPGEDAWAAAAREVEEEIGVPAAGLTPLGAGPPVYAAVTNFSVASFAAHLAEPPAHFTPDRSELEGILEIPLENLLDTASWMRAVEPWMGLHFPWKGASVWGLTARILDGLLPSFRAALAGRGWGSPAEPPP
jgi:8-oxo-dGTP pyrophosphatase MutT (NUDIX family)